MFLNQFKQTLKKKEVQDKLLACAGSAAFVAAVGVTVKYGGYTDHPIVVKGWHMDNKKPVNQNPSNSKPPGLSR